MRGAASANRHNHGIELPILSIIDYPLSMTTFIGVS